MKKSLILIVLFLIHKQLHAQTEYLVKVDLATGGITKINKIDDVRWISGSTVTYNPVDKNIIFCGDKTKIQDSFKLYSVNNQNGNVISNPSFPYFPTPFGFTYNKTDKKFYAFRWDSTVKKEYLIAADLTTGIQTDVMEITDLVAFYNIGITFDDKHQKFYIHGKKKLGGPGFFIVDIVKKTVTMKPISVNGFGVFQYDNTLEKIFCLRWTGNNDYVLSTIDTNGNISPVGTIPRKINGWMPERLVYDQKHHYFIFCGQDTSYTHRLFTINTTDASIVHEPVYPTPYKGSDPLFDNLIFPVHDENTDDIYALYWEAFTPSDTIYFPDSTLAIDVIPKQLKTDCIIAPNAFSPNGDGRNDVFCAKAICNTRKFNMQVFNRRGQKVFESDNIKEGWDGDFKGSPAGMDTYVYMIHYQTDTSEPQTLQGNISLIR